MKKTTFKQISTAAIIATMLATASTAATQLASPTGAELLLMLSGFITLFLVNIFILAKLFSDNNED